MQIRAITYFLNLGWPLDEQALQQARAFSKASRQAFQADGFLVQSARLACDPYPDVLPSLDGASLLALAKALEESAPGLGYDYVSLGPALPDRPESYALIPDVLGETQNVFFSGLMTTPQGGVSLPAVRACAEVIHRAAPLSPDGFANLRFAALANVPPGAPFFPAAYHNRTGEGGRTPTFALAIEAADLAVAAFSSAGSLAEARRALVASVEEHAGRLERAARRLSAQFKLPFGGIDFTLAPFPEEMRSLGTALERLGVPAVGLNGSLAAAALLTDTLDLAEFPRTGFNGLMLPVLEDAALAKRAAEGLLSVNDLLMYSAVCGTGLDTIPLPGDTSPEAIAAVLLDLAALSQRLDKQLTARLMPIPGKAAGDPTGFDFAYFANSRVMALNAGALKGFLAGEETFTLRPRRSSH